MAAKKPKLEHYLKAVSTWGLDRPGRVYSVLSAVRGPDCVEKGPAHQLKDMLTSRLRYIVFKRDICRGNIDGLPFTVDHLAQLHEWVEANRGAQVPGLRHYASHLYDAVETTKKHRVWGGYADQIAQELLTLAPY